MDLAASVQHSEVVTALLPVLHAINWPAVGERALYALGGFLVALVGAYLVLARDVAYIKGKIDEMHNDHDAVESLKREVGQLRSQVSRRIGGAAVSTH